MLVQFVQVKPVPGVHVYEDAPLAVNVVADPWHIDESIAVTLTVGVGLTVRVTVLLSLQPSPSVPTTVYVVVEPGLAVGLKQLVQLNPPDGLHK